MKIVELIKNNKIKVVATAVVISTLVASYVLSEDDEECATCKVEVKSIKVTVDDKDGDVYWNDKEGKLYLEDAELQSIITEMSRNNYRKSPIDGCKYIGKSSYLFCDKNTTH